MTVSNKWLGRLVALDERDRAFHMSRLLRAVAPTTAKQKTWRISANALNQGPTGTCCGHGGFNWLRCEPLRTEKGTPSPFDLYGAAVLLDEFPENDAEAMAPQKGQYGTTVRALAKALTNLGYAKSYVWAWDVNTAAQWLLTQGPLIVGVNWYSTFDKPDAEGIIRLTPKSRLEGGHCFLIRGINLKTSLALGTNSWGDDWGLSGEMKIPLEVLGRLMQEDGEFCAAIEQKLKPTKISIKSPAPSGLSTAVAA